MNGCCANSPRQKIEFERYRKSAGNLERTPSVAGSAASSQWGRNSREQKSETCGIGPAVHRVDKEQLHNASSFWVCTKKSADPTISYFVLCFALALICFVGG